MVYFYETYRGEYKNFSKYLYKMQNWLQVVLLKVPALGQFDPLCLFRIYPIVVSDYGLQEDMLEIKLCHFFLSKHLYSHFC